MSQLASYEGAPQNILPRVATGQTVARAIEVPVYAWEKTDPNPEEQRECLEKLKEEIRARKFSQPALRAVFYNEAQAKFLDDFLWNHIGDPVMQGRWKAKSPDFSDGVSEYAYNYNRPLINGYTDKGYLLNVRETYDTDAAAKDRYAVVIGHMATQTVARYRINEINTSVDDRTGEVRKKLIITTDQFDAIDGKTVHDDATTTSGIMALNEEIMAQSDRHDRQAYIMLSQNSAFKPYDEAKQSIGDIQRVVRERHYLTKLAISAGVARDNQVSLELPSSYLHQVA